ncbi:hypothetical protein R1sor_003001 [Riccia sorocarpa]|uniref:Uncharacterized protein n=1 Tax=Riccia sorocarpa TaxID=122646 RepID=A0ABD3H6H0_9MARC
MGKIQAHRNLLKPQPGEQVQLADAKHRPEQEAEAVRAEAGNSLVKTLSKPQVSTDAMLTNADNVEDLIESVNESPTSGGKDFNKSAVVLRSVLEAK